MLRLQGFMNLMDYFSKIFEANTKLADNWEIEEKL